MTKRRLDVGMSRLAWSLDPFPVASSHVTPSAPWRPPAAAALTCALVRPRLIVTEVTDATYIALATRLARCVEPRDRAFVYYEDEEDGAVVAPGVAGPDAEVEHDFDPLFDEPWHSE